MNKTWAKQLMQAQWCAAKQSTRCDALCVSQIEGQLAQREAELQSCRAQLADTERLLEAAMHLPAAITAETALAAEPTAPGMVKPSDSSSG